MTAREPIKVIGDVIASELDLISSGPESQIMLEYERFNIPPNDKLYVALSYVDGKAIANNNYYEANSDTEIQQVVMLYHIQIDIMSFSAEARLRKEEIYQALRSIAAQVAMETNNLQIARMPSAFVNAASLEESKMLNRFTITIAVTAMTTKTQVVDQKFDMFPFQYDENNSGKSPIIQPEAL